jgi:Ca-activated chloride channel family protein
MVLRESPDRGDANFMAATERARRFLGDDEDGYRAEFIRLAERAANLRGRDGWRESRR